MRFPMRSATAIAALVGLAGATAAGWTHRDRLAVLLDQMMAETAPLAPVARNGTTSSGRADTKTARLTAATDPVTTAGVPEMRPSRSVGLVRSALSALEEGDLGQVRALRDGLPEEDPDLKLITWMMMETGKPELTLAEINEAGRLLAGWPGAERLRRDAERAFVREVKDPVAIIARLGERPTETLAGAMALARSYVVVGDTEKARQALAPLWRTERLSDRDESRVLSEFGSLLSQEDHRARAFEMLYQDRARSAERIASRTGATSLIRAWTAVIRGERGAAKLLESVDPSLTTLPEHRYAKIRHMRSRDDARGAAALLVGAGPTTESDAAADAWWTERRIVSRDLREADDAKTAYAVVVGHTGGTPAVRAEALFHAGWYALRDLDDPKAAEIAFRKIGQVTDGPISAARGAYWTARALEAQGLDEARLQYEAAAAYPTTYYGQLAARALGRTTLDLREPVLDEAVRTRFERRELVMALRRLEEAGAAERAAPIKMFLAENLTDPAELALLAGAAIAQDNHYLALRIGKRARWNGAATGFLTHPIGAIPDSAGLAADEAALAYAIARQESEFNVSAVSGAGARGLLQILPGTAREVAASAGLPYSGERLTTDAAYNATLGHHFLSEQLARNNGSYILTFIAYNAGPRRVREWIGRFGDPRGKPLDEVIDWVEQIPFTETRNYVMRVMENLQVYKARLGEPLTIVEDLQAGSQG